MPCRLPVTPAPTPAPTPILAWECFQGVCTFVGEGGTYVSEGQCSLDCFGPPVAPPANPPSAPPPINPPTSFGGYSCDCGFGCTAQVEPCGYSCINCGETFAPAYQP